MNFAFRVFFGVLLVLTVGCGSKPDQGPLRVVAAENFYGDVVSQIGGGKVQVTSLLSDPNVDPHEYESNVADAKAVADSDLVVENGGGYDDWVDKLLSASAKSGRVVLKAFDLVPTKLPDNEHVWYDPKNVGVLAQRIAEELKKLDPADGAVFDAGLTAFLGALGQVNQKIQDIRAQFEGTPMALTETIFLYQTGPLGLQVLTPFGLQKAVAEGEDPPATAAVEADAQIKGKQVKVLVYNEQTSTPVTEKLKHSAQSALIPLVQVTETMPQGEHYQTWMLSQLQKLEEALGK